MRQQPFGPGWRAGLLAGALLAGAASAGLAQNQAVITGRVTSDRGGPIAGATVIVNSTNFGASSNANGVYQIVIGAASARGQTVTLTARALGFRPKSVQIQLTVGTKEQDFELSTDPLRLEELVVTGVSEATSTRRLTFSVGRVSDEQLNVAPAVTAVGALQGKVSGVQIMSSTGLPGAAPQIRLRGATSITGTSDPLVIIDGTVSNYSMADIASEDIERVEVIKGAAASSLYGSNAANGVIQIFTKRGANLADGKISVTTRFEGGRNWISKTFPVTQHTSYLLNPDGTFFRRSNQSRVLPSQCAVSDNYPGGCPKKGTNGAAIDIQDQVYPEYIDTKSQLFDPGDFFTQYVSVGQRRGRTNFNTSFQNTYNQGSVFNVNGFKRQNYRMNIDQVLNDNLDLSVQAFYGRSTNEEPSAGGEGGAFFDIAFLEPHIDPTAGCTKSGDTVTCPDAQDIGKQKIGYNPDGSPYNAFIRDKRSNAANPIYRLYAVKREQNRGRFSGGGKVRWRPFTWLSAEGNYNYDQLTSEYIYREPVEYYGASGAATPGGYERSQYNNRSYNAGATVTGVWRVQGSGLFTNLGITAKGAYVYEDQEDHYLQATATKFIVKQVPEFPGTDPTNQRATSSDEIIRNRNVFGIATVDFNEKVLVDGLIRRDGSSLFGPDARFKTYWRASGSLRLPQLLGWTGGPEEWRLRASYGTAGLRPPFRAQYEVLEPSGGVFVKQQLGNKNLRPAQSAELEVGTNLELLNGRVTVEYNYSEKETKDQIILAPLLATTGFESQWQNVGALKATAHELAIGAQVINSRDVALQVNITADRVRETITDWPLPEALYGPDDSFSPFRFAAGVRLGTMRGQRWVHDMAELKMDPAKANANEADYVVNADGYLVLKSQRGTNAERPIKMVACTDASCTKTTDIFDIGVAAPDFRMGMNSTLAYKRFAITGTLDWSQGGKIYNGTAHWGNQDCAAQMCDQFEKAPADRIAEGFYQVGLYNGASANEGFVEDATFLKVREMSINYTFSRSELSKVGLGRLSELRLGLIGRNLFTWTPYTGLDPDVAPLTELNGAQSGFRTRMDWFQYPQFRTFTAAIEIAF